MVVKVIFQTMAVISQHDYLRENIFVQNQQDHCVYTKQNDKERIRLIFWGNDLIIVVKKIY